MNVLKPYYALWESSDGFYSAEIEERPGDGHYPTMIRVALAFGAEAGFEGELLPSDAEDLIGHLGACAGMAKFRDRERQAADTTEGTR